MHSRWHGSFIWNLELPPRIKLFLWILIHGRLLTNQRRHSLEFTETAACSTCRQATDSIEHVFLECANLCAVRSLFNLPHFNRYVHPFHFIEWLICQLKTTTDMHSTLPWHCFLATMFWCLWRRRCQAIFQPQSKLSRNIVQCIQDYWLKWMQTQLVARRKEPKVIVLIKWEKPPAGVVKLII